MDKTIITRMASLRKHLSTLKLVQFAKPQLRKSIITHCDLDFIKTILECIQNTLAGNIRLTARETRRLKKFRTILRKILKAPGNLHKKRHLLIQSGGSFLPDLLKPIVSAVQYAVKNEARTQNGSR